MLSDVVSAHRDADVLVPGFPPAGPPAAMPAPGHRLAEALAGGPMDVRSTLAWAVPLAELLAAVHGRGIVHGDVSPATVVLTGDGPPALLDLDPGPGSGATSGTLAPEADVYSLGLCCYRALTGCGPQGPWVPLDQTPGVPHELVVAVGGALEVDPARRWPDAEAFAGALRAAAAPSTRPGRASGPRPEPADSTGAGRRRPGILVALAAVSAVSLLAGLGGLWWSRQDTGTASPAATAPASTPTVAGDACVPAVVPPGAVGERGIGAVVVAGDTAGDGCTRAGVYAQEGSQMVLTIEVPSLGPGLRRLAIGSPGQSLVLGDWNCDGLDTPAVLDAGAGVVDYFDSWGGAPAGPRRSAYPGDRRSGPPEVVTDSSGCDRITVP